MSFANHDNLPCVSLHPREAVYRNEMTYTRSIDGLNWKSSYRVNCPIIEISVADIQRGVRRILRSGRRVSDYWRLSRHAHHLALLLNVTLGFIDRLLPYAVLFLSVIFILPQLFRALARILSILQMMQNDEITLRNRQDRYDGQQNSLIITTRTFCSSVQKLILCHDSYYVFY